MVDFDGDKPTAQLKHVDQIILPLGCAGSFAPKRERHAGPTAVLAVNPNSLNADQGSRGIAGVRQVPEEGRGTKIKIDAKRSLATA
jgi:hypothetical protein